MKARTLRHVILVITLMTLNACGGSPYYTSEPFDARVVDANTGQPIAGAIVLAHWALRQSMALDSPGIVDELEVVETTTDSDGRFHIPGFTKLNPSLKVLWWEDPAIIIYKPGYDIGGVFRSEYSLNEVNQLPAKRKSQLAGKTLRLPPWTGDDEKKATYLSSLHSSLNEVIWSCHWKEAPHFFAALDKETLTVRANRPRLVFSGITLEELPKCGADPIKLRETGK